MNRRTILLAAALACAAAVTGSTAASAVPAGTSNYQAFHDIGGSNTQYHSTTSYYSGLNAQTCVLATGYYSSAWDFGYEISLRATPSKALWVSPTYHGDHKRCSPWVTYRGNSYTRITTYEFSHLKDVKVWSYRN
ncbi:hypothetical protein [Kitasatospora cathayae]|uniref:Uncharacterized protein n=1 Tax=Kitasatospora cathayae TaxID=3004092 RepID=A0ABY7QG28_9ACTN|nr:hypothetical protein [Kitasatospora sp. HUAS 3-15]WBP91369.1 hypothetical protein O1G21_39500 [Kitasatospora sp. HUAS 3-15]